MLMEDSTAIHAGQLLGGALITHVDIHVFVVSITQNAHNVYIGQNALPR